MRAIAAGAAFVAAIESWIFPTWAGMLPPHDLDTGRIISAIFAASGLILLGMLDLKR